MSWARVDDGLWEHPKFVAMREAGEHRAMALWVLAVSYCGRKQNPRLADCEAQMLLMCSEADAKQTVDVLRSRGLLDDDSASKQTRSSLVHDWEIYRSKDEAKAHAGRQGGVKSGETRRSKTKQTRSTHEADDGFASKQTRTPVPVPVPVPVPDPDPVPGSDPRSTDVPCGMPACGLNPIQVTSTANRIAEVKEVVDHWREKHPDQFLMLNPSGKEARGILQLLTSEGCTVHDLCLAIDGIHKDTWAERPKFLTLAAATKDLASVQRFKALALGAGEPQRTGCWAQPVRRPDDDT